MARTRFPGRQKQKLSDGSIVFGNTIFRKRRAQVDQVIARDPKLRVRTTVDMQRSARLDELGTKLTSGRKTSLRKKSIVQPPYVTMSEAAKRRTTKTYRKRSIRLSPPIKEPKVKQYLPSPGRAPKRNHSVAKLLKRKGPPRKKSKIGTMPKKMGRSGKKQGSSVSRLSILVPTNRVLINLVCKFQITLQRDSAIDAKGVEWRKKQDQLQAGKEDQAHKVLGHEEQEDETSTFNPHLDSAEKSVNEKLRQHVESFPEDQDSRGTVGIEVQLPMNQEVGRIDDLETQLIPTQSDNRVLDDSDEQDDSVEGDIEIEMEVTVETEDIEEAENGVDNVKLPETLPDLDVEQEVVKSPTEFDDNQNQVDGEVQMQVEDQNPSEIMASLLADTGEVDIDTNNDDLDLIPDWAQEPDSDTAEFSADIADDDDDVVTNGIVVAAVDSSADDSVPFIDFGKEIRNALSAKQGAGK